MKKAPCHPMAELALRDIHSPMSNRSFAKTDAIVEELVKVVEEQWNQIIKLNTYAMPPIIIKSGDNILITLCKQLNSILGQDTDQCQMAVEDRAKMVVNRLLEADRVIHEYLSEAGPGPREDWPDSLKDALCYDIGWEVIPLPNPQDIGDKAERRPQDDVSGERVDSQD